MTDCCALGFFLKNKPLIAIRPTMIGTSEVTILQDTIEARTPTLSLLSFLMYVLMPIVTSFPVLSSRDALW